MEVRGLFSLFFNLFLSVIQEELFDSSAGCEQCWKVFLNVAEHCLTPLLYIFGVQTFDVADVLYNSVSHVYLMLLSTILKIIVITVILYHTVWLRITEREPVYRT